MINKCAERRGDWSGGSGCSHCPCAERCRAESPIGAELSSLKTSSVTWSLPSGTIQFVKLSVVLYCVKERLLKQRLCFERTWKSSTQWSFVVRAAGGIEGQQKLVSTDWVKREFREAWKYSPTSLTIEEL